MVKFKKMLLFLVMILTIFNMQNVKAATKNINVESVNIKDKSGTIVVEDPVLSNNEITSNISFKEQGDFVTLEFTLKNNEKDKNKIYRHSYKRRI